MKILWIEDFGGGLEGPLVAIDMFGELIPATIFNQEYDEDEELSTELPRLFEKHTLHKIFICQSYLEWKSTFTEQNGDFDIVIIDINLERHKTPPSAMPEDIEQSGFDKQAGFYIYHQLIRRGFPDKNIAFFTGEEKSLLDFTEHCKNILIDKPKHTFEKTQTDYKKLRTWIAEKEQTPYLALRRGIIEGCRFLKDELSKVNDLDLESRLIFYKTTTLGINKNPTLYRTNVEEYLTGLENFFPWRQPENTSYIYLLFIKELAAKWDISFGFFNKNKELPAFKTKLEENFNRTCQFLIKRLRNWTVHDLLSHDISEKEVAYFFMLTMRSWLHLPLDGHFIYEDLFSPLFVKRLSAGEVPQALGSLKYHLEESYFALKTNYDDLLRYMREVPEMRTTDNHFLGMLRSYSESPEKLAENLSDKFRQRFRELSVILSYQSYWHGLFPLWIETTYYANFQSVNFNIQALPEDSFLFFLGGLIFHEAFNDGTQED